MLMATPSCRHLLLVAVASVASGCGSGPIELPGVARTEGDRIRQVRPAGPPMLDVSNGKSRIRQPIRSRAAGTRRAFAAGQ